MVCLSLVAYLWSQLTQKYYHFTIIIIIIIIVVIIIIIIISQYGLRMKDHF